MKPIQVGLLGIGTVGSGVFNVLRRNQHEIRRRAGRGIEVSMVADLDTTRAKSIVGGLDSPKMGLKSVPAAGSTAAAPPPKASESPNTSPRAGTTTVTAGTARSAVLAGGPARRGTRTSTRDIPAAGSDSGTPAASATQEWVESYVRAAIAEAVAPLLAEIETLKAQLRAKDDEGADAHEDEYR